jgi:uncharacterized membrane protein
MKKKKNNIIAMPGLWFMLAGLLVIIFNGLIGKLIGSNFLTEGLYSLVIIAFGLVIVLIGIMGLFKSLRGN